MAIVLERLGAAEALVPVDLFAADGSLVPNAVKMEAMMVELLSHVDAGSSVSGYVASVFEQL